MHDTGINSEKWQNSADRFGLLLADAALRPISVTPGIIVTVACFSTVTASTFNISSASDLRREDLCIVLPDITERQRAEAGFILILLPICAGQDEPYVGIVPTSQYHSILTQQWNRHWLTPKDVCFPARFLSRALHSLRGHTLLKGLWTNPLTGMQPGRQMEIWRKVVTRIWERDGRPAIAVKKGHALLVSADTLTIDETLNLVDWDAELKVDTSLTHKKLLSLESEQASAESSGTTEVMSNQDGVSFGLEVTPPTDGSCSQENTTNEHTNSGVENMPTAGGTHGPTQGELADVHWKSTAVDCPSTTNSATHDTISNASLNSAEQVEIPAEALPTFYQPNNSIPISVRPKTPAKSQGPSSSPSSARLTRLAAKRSASNAFPDEKVSLSYRNIRPKPQTRPRTSAASTDGGQRPATAKTRSPASSKKPSHAAKASNNGPQSSPSRPKRKPSRESVAHSPVKTRSRTASGNLDPVQGELPM